MRHPVARISRAGTLVVAVALLTVACGDTQPGTAAYVGAGTISVDELQKQVGDVLTYRTGAGAPTAARGTDTGNTDVRSRLPLVTQQVLSQDVLARLVDSAVQRNGFHVDEGALATQLATLDTPTLLAQPAQGYLTPDRLAALVRDQLVLAQLGKQAWDGLSVSADLVQATDRGDAQAKAQRMSAGVEASAGVVAQTVAAGKQGERGLTLTPADAAALATTPVFSTPEGGAIAFELTGQQSQAPQWYAARINSRTTHASASTSSGAVNAEQATIGQTLSLGLTLLAQLAGTPQITINPRYGQWDHTAGRVIAASDVAASVVLAPAG